MSTWCADSAGVKKLPGRLEQKTHCLISAVNLLKAFSDWWEVVLLTV